jgi:peptide/nickel transport system substrate-binding protein
LVVLSAESFTGSWDPVGHTNLANSHLQWVLLNHLVHMDYDTWGFYPELATEWRFLEDGYTLELKLRKGVKFHDGTEFTAKDAKATIEHMTNQSGTRSGDWGQQFYGEVVDDYTVRIWPENKLPAANLLTGLSYTPVLSAADIADETRLKSRINGTGPYKMDRYENQTAYLSANENYWNVEDKARIPFVEFRYVPESQTRLAALQTGEAHLIERVESEQLAIIDADPNLVSVGGPVAEQKYMVFKNTQPPMDNVLVRKAISHAIDRETIVNDIMAGYARLADSYLAKPAANYTPIADFPQYDVEKAKALLAEAGYPGGKGLPTLNYITSVGFYPKTKEYGEYIVSNLNEIGLNINFQPMETARWGEALYAEDSCHMIDTGWMNDGNEDNHIIYITFHSPGLLDFSNNPAADAALQKQVTKLDPEERKQVIHDELWPALLENMSTFPLFDSYMIYAHAGNLKGFKILPTSNMSFWKYSFED